MKIHAPNARLTWRHDWCPGLASFRVRPDEGEPTPFVPGQFTNIALPERAWGEDDGASIKRAYSIASSPGLPEYEFFIRLVDEGALTPRLWDLEVGAPIWLDHRIAGHFTLESAADAEDLILVATGTGVAPYRPMIADAARERFGRVVLFYSDRQRHDIGYTEEFERLAAEDPNFFFFPTLTREPEDSDWKGLRGRVQQHLTPEAYEALTGRPLTPERCQVYTCGNPQMITTLQEQLGELGFKKHRKRDPGQLHMEKYW